MTPAGRVVWTYTIFEGTSGIQRLIIARAISVRRLSNRLPVREHLVDKALMMNSQR